MPARRPDHSKLTPAERLSLLTMREAEVLRLLGEPLSPAEIATRLRLTKRTVETHIANMARKTGYAGVQRLTWLAGEARRLEADILARSPEATEEVRAVIRGHKKSRQALESVAEGTAEVSGQFFFERFVSSLARALGVRAAAILETTSDPEMLRTVALAIDGANHSSRLVPRATTRFAGDVRALSSTTEEYRRVFPNDPLALEIGATHVLTQPLHDAGGAFLGGILLFHDRPLDELRSPELIVRLFAGRVASELERQRSDRQLREREALYRMLTEHSSDVVSRFDIRGDHIYVSPSVEIVLGWKPEELMGRSGYALVHPEDLSRVGETHHAVLRGPGPQRVRFRCLCRDKSYLWVEVIVQAQRDPITGEAIAMVSSTRDVSAEQRALESRDRTLAELDRRVEQRTAELAGSEERWRSALQHALVYVCLFNLDLRITFCNRKIEELRGVEVIGSRAEDYLAPEFREVCLGVMRRVIQTGVAETLQAETEVKGTRHIWLCTYSPLIVGGRIEGLATIAHDITQSTRMERSVVESEARYRGLVEMAPDGILLHDGSRIRYANVALARLLHYTSGEELVGLEVLDLVHPSDRGIVRERIAGLLTREKSAPPLRETLVRRDGSLVRVDVTGSACDLDGSRCVQVLVREAIDAVRVRDRLEQRT